MADRRDRAGGEREDDRVRLHSPRIRIIREIISADEAGVSTRYGTIHGLDPVPEF